MAGIKWEYIVTAIFALFSLIFVALIFVQMNFAEDYRQKLLKEINDVDSAGFTLQEIPASPLTDKAVEEYNELAERPLFFQERRPVVLVEDEAAKAELVAEAALEEMALSLIGIINTPDNNFALFHDPKAKPDESKFKRLKQGEEIEGRKVKEIKSDRVIFSSASGDEELLLTKPRKHKKTASRKRKKHTRKNPFNRKMKK